MNNWTKRKHQPELAETQRKTEEGGEMTLQTDMVIRISLSIFILADNQHYIPNHQPLTDSMRCFSMALPYMSPGAEFRSIIFQCFLLRMFVLAFVFTFGFACLPLSKTHRHVSQVHASLHQSLLSSAESTNSLNKLYSLQPNILHVQLMW